MVNTTRLVDYFVVAGYDHSHRGRLNDRGGFTCQGTIKQRFPLQDWSDTPFIDGLEHFCQPGGWLLRPEPWDPQFFVSVLTDIEGRRHYCACLSFSEAVPKDLIEAANERQTADEEFEDVAGDHVVDSTTSAGQASIISGRRFTSLGRPVRSNSLPRHVVPGISLPGNAHDTILFAPKCLVLVSRHDLPDVFRNCLNVIYTAYSECLVLIGGERVRLENLVGNLLSVIHVPDEGGGAVRFSLGANDKMVFHAPIHPSIPITGTRVALLFRQLGIRNVISILMAALTEHKLLFHSQSYSRLTDSCNAVVALLYPMKYSHVFIPILPSALIEVLSTPTPFIIGVTSSNAREVSGELLDVISVDLDGGAMHVPESVKIPMMNEYLASKIQQELFLVFKPGLGVADKAFLTDSSIAAKKPSTLLDKELRAVILRLMVQLLEGYRSCLTIVRIHPSPYITFHKAAFLGIRNQCDSDFAKKVLNCMFFNTFVTERGVPWRHCDIFDDLYSQLGEQTQQELADPSKVMRHIQQLAEELYRNENPLPSSSQKLPRPSDGAHLRVHQPVFPQLDEALVTQIILAGLESCHASGGNPSQKNLAVADRLVPMGMQMSCSENGLSSASRTLMPNSARKVEVLRNCIASIFENKISDAKKTFPAVISALKSRQARLAFCEELAVHKSGHQVLLEHQQFEMIVRLMNAALQDDSDMDEYGIAASLLPLSTVFGRKLAKGVVQYSYTLIQDHAVWQNQQFWEASFYNDVQTGIKSVYLAMQDQNSNNRPLSLSDPSQSSCESSISLPPASIDRYPSQKSREVRRSAVVNPSEQSVLELTAEEIKKWGSLSEEVKKDLIMAEEKTVYSQAFDYANKMICLLCPLEVNPKRLGRRLDDYENVSNSISNSVAESDSIDVESVYEDQELSDNGQNVIKFVLRFADKVCSESQVTQEHIKAVNQMIPGAVMMHMEMLEAVAAEAKRLPLIQKPKINSPNLLPGEVLIKEQGLRVYLLPDGREDVSSIGQKTSLLPAEGALFLSNYRVIFKGTPIDPFASEHTITRYFPVSSLTKEKKITINEYLTEIKQQLKEGLQMRSNTFQLLRVAFDDEVAVEEVDSFRHNLHRLRYPEHIFQLFAFRRYHSFAQEQSRGKEKHAKYGTIRGFASKTLKNVSRAAGIKAKSRKTSRYMLPNMMPVHGRLSVPDMTHHESKIREDEENSESGEVMASPSTPVGIATNSSKSLDRMTDRSYYKDWIRLNLVSADQVLSMTSKAGPTDSFRVTTINSRYSIISSYPALVVVPSKISDDFLKRYCRLHRLNRLPAITWKHPVNKSLLLRGSAYHSRGVMGLIRRHHDGHQAGSGQAEMATTYEAEVYLTNIIQSTPRAMIRPDSSWNMAGSSGEGGTSCSDYAVVNSYATLTPNMARKLNPISRAVDTLTRNTPVPSKLSRMSLSSMKGQKHAGSQTSLSPAGASVLTPGACPSLRHFGDPDPAELGGGGGSGMGGINALFQRTSLYIFADKYSRLKLDGLSKAELIPVDYPEARRIRASFKKLMRACVPSSAAVGAGVANQNDQTFLKCVESSEWMHHLSMLLQMSAAVVNLMDGERASVMLCLEDGWDVTSQVSSLSQLCMDPFYRTIEGFRVLIEKEWLAFGHRFNHRSNVCSASQDYIFTPIFLQFLDAVHQIHYQYPSAFEFNQYYLRFLAYHHISCRFRTFLSDSEQLAVQAGLLSDEKRRGSLYRERSQDGCGHTSDEDANSTATASNLRMANGASAFLSASGSSLGVDIFDYIERQYTRSPIFFNFSYSLDPEGNQVLRPCHLISSLKIWDYYISEELKYGPSYEFELINMDLEMEEDQTDSTLKSGRSVHTAGYDCLSRTHVSFFAGALQQICKLESDSGHMPHRWHHHWKSLQIPASLPVDQGLLCPVEACTRGMIRRHHSKIMQRKATMDLIWRAKTGGSASGGIHSSADTSFVTSHRFEKYNYSTPTSCDLCSSLLWGPRTGLRCSDCGYNCHEKCRDNAPKACARFAKLPRDPTTDNFETLNKDYDLDRIPHGRSSIFTRSSTDDNSQIIHQGYLFKKANFRIKGWKQRWFVLDSTKHQLRYYDTREDFQCRGHIDLSEVIKVVETSSGSAGKPDGRCFFELQTVKRTYALCSDSAMAAQDWITKIQNCLQ